MGTKSSTFYLSKDWGPACGAKTTIHFPEDEDKIDEGIVAYKQPDLIPLDFSVSDLIEESQRNGEVKNLVFLRKELTKIWNNVDVNYRCRTIDLMKHRTDACIKADGGHFENCNYKNNV
ncbi:hypothetical protein RB195_000915 [Necator americanus]|uniref:Uncharacterized protein n=1 Tax=Necator americanus TaxID=51031 RepID=A0ABR1DD81_NECAM